MKILYTSSDVHKAIKTIFDKKYKRRIAVVAYLGESAESYLPSPKGIKIICCPEPGATSPSSVRSLISRGAEVQFSDDLHAKVYWSKGGCIVTSANISHRALGRSNQKETGVLIDSDNYDIDRLIDEVDPYNVTQKAMDFLEKQERKLKRAIGKRQHKKNVKYFIDWYKSPYKEPWKIGWWSDADISIAQSAINKSKLEYGVTEPVDLLNVSKSQVASNDWLLCFEISGNNIRNIGWMYVDFVVPVEAEEIGAYEEDYPFQAVQVHKLNQYPKPPFVIEKDFLSAFSNAAKEYGTDKIAKSKRLLIPKSLIDKTAEYLT